jgi:PAS domain S-box-containing protein
VYAETDEMLAQVVPYVKAGLLNGERCIYVADEHEQHTIAAALARGGIDVDREADAQRLVFWNRHHYRQPGEFDLKTMLNFVNHTLDDALEDGHRGIRLAVEMSWTINNGVDEYQLVRWEDLINTISHPGSKVSFLCQYNSRLLSSDLVKKAVYVHPTVVLGRAVCPNLYYRSADEALKASHGGNLQWLLTKLSGRAGGGAAMPALERIWEVMETVLTQLPIGVYLCEAPSGAVKYFNGRVSEIWGIRPNLNDGKGRDGTAPKLLTADGAELPLDQCPTAQAIRHGVIVTERELIVERPDGSRRTVLISGTPIRGKDGRPMGALALMQDITERKQAEMEMAALVKTLEESRASLQEKIDDLEKFERAVVGRELKMIEQEHEIERLKKELEVYRARYSTC